ncbi:MAG TPA: ribosome maturation factor RimM [Solirubrobacteraceae bacterium]|nr:ribosome maturation factor RimM [Solirubrobacteraceae bacterium]
MTAGAGEPTASKGVSQAVPAGRVGRAHGLDGSFYVTGARPRLLVVGSPVMVDGHTATIVRRAGTDEHPIVRLEETEDRRAAEALRGLELTVELAAAPSLEEGEWWAQELEGCEVVDGERHIGTVIGLVELPSCEALEVRIGAPDGDAGRVAGSSADELLVPMVRDAIRHVDPAGRRIDVDMDFLGDV